MLLLALFFSVAAGTAASVLLDLLPNEATSLRLARRDVEASQVVEAGVRDCMAWISHQLKNDVEPLSTVSTSRNGNLGAWTWAATITADPFTPPNPTSGLRMYKIVSTASWDHQPKRKVVCWLQAGVSFTKYAAFTHNTPPPGWTSFFLRYNQTAVDGAFRTNGRVRLTIPSNFFSGAPPTNQGFLGTVTAAGSTGAGDGIEYPLSAPTGQHDYERMSNQGRSGFLTGAAPMAMPSSTQPYASAAYGSLPPASPPAGVTVNPDGGIYVNGALDSLVLSVDLLGNSVYTMTQGGVTTRVTRVSESPVGPASVGTRLVEQGSVQTVVPNLGSGVLYASEGISAVNGTVRGDNTLATDFNNGRDIEITGNLLRQDTMAGQKPTSRRDNLGLIASHVKITDNVAVLPRTGNILRIYASIFTQDNFYAEGHNNTALGVGGLEVFGSVISSNNWLTQINGGASGFAISGFSHPSGQGSFRLVTDPNSGFFPPPLFPASSKGQMEIRYWKETVL
ncbi:hypothetical protein ABS71_14380 [bacterium SCN 62-11]|nr:MAG: hypothetical protein ABS71_14380 [bacterium SCN 62-11]